MWKPALKAITKTFFTHSAIFFTLFFLPLQNISAADAIKVKTSPYNEIKINLNHSLGAVVPAENSSNLSAQISALIQQFHVDTGFKVKKGELLVTLNCRENHLKLEQSKANLKAKKAQLENAKYQFNQAKKLSKKGSISKEIYNQRKADESRLNADVEHRKASISLAQINVDRCQIKAPFSGYITHRSASIGELTQVGTVLLKLVSISNDVVEVKVNSRLLNSFTQGQKHQFVFDDKTYALQIKHIVSVLDSASRNHIARLNFIDKHAVTGSVGKITWQETRAAIPARYIVLRDNKLGVFIAENGRAKFIEIKNALKGQAAFIELDNHVQIITQGRFNVKHGDAIQLDSRKL